MSEPVHDVVVIGGGISGIGTVIALRDAGFFDVLVLERASELGGTWRQNTYPGCASDVPGPLYSWSTPPFPEFTSFFPTQPEIREYVLEVADHFGVPEHCELGVDVREARFDRAEAIWRLTTTAGERCGRYLIVAAGPLHEPRIPGGVATDGFGGVSFHSSRWDHTCELGGKRVAVVGTGASCVQFIPHVQKRAGSVVVLQRTPGWVMPKPDVRIGPVARRGLRRVPGARRALRELCWLWADLNLRAAHHPRLSIGAEAIAKRAIRRAVGDPEMRRLLTPDYPLGCKRAMFSNDYYRALAKPNVTLIPHALREVRARSVIAADGSEHPTDVLIYGTGFHVSDRPIAHRIFGARGESMATVWGGSPRALFGTAVPEFPNAFLIFGPNVGTVSAFVMLEAQLAYITSALTQMRDRHLASLEVRTGAAERFKTEVERRLAGSVFTACDSYYRDSTGANYSVWPGTMREMTRRLARCDLAQFHIAPAVERPPMVAQDVGSGAP